MDSVGPRSLWRGCCGLAGCRFLGRRSIGGLAGQELLKHLRRLLGCVVVGSAGLQILAEDAPPDRDRFGGAAALFEDRR